MASGGRYYSRDEWVRVKFPGEMTVKFVESWLHYEGLKCVTSGERYHLEPEVGELKYSSKITAEPPAIEPAVVALVTTDNTSSQFKTLPPLVPGTEVRGVYISDLLQPSYPFPEWAAMLKEVYVKDYPAPLQYADLFLEITPAGWVNFAGEIYRRKRAVTVWWDQVPAPPPFTSEPNPSGSVYAGPVGDDFPGSHGPIPPEAEDLELSLAEAVAHFHLDGLPDEQLVGFFATPHAFLVIGGVAFFTSNLQACLGPPQCLGPPYIDFEVDGFNFAEWGNEESPSN